MASIYGGSFDLSNQFNGMAESDNFAAQLRANILSAITTPSAQPNAPVDERTAYLNQLDQQSEDRLKLNKEIIDQQLKQVQYSIPPWQEQYRLGRQTQAEDYQRLVQLRGIDQANRTQTNEQLHRQAKAVNEQLHGHNQAINEQKHGHNQAINDQLYTYEGSRDMGTLVNNMVNNNSAENRQRMQSVTSFWS